MNYFFKIIITLFFSATYTFADPLVVKAMAHQKLSLVICTLGASHHLEDVGQTVARDINFSGQCLATIQQWGKKKVTKELLHELYDAGYTLALFVNIKKKKYIEWRLYDTMDTQLTMLAGKRYRKQGDSARGWGHSIADAVWPVITGEKSFFSSKLAYCMDALSEKGHRVTQVCIADFDGSYPQVIVDTPTINIAPCWNHDPCHPVLFYSAHTNQNLCLMRVTMDKKMHIASNFDGINMLPTFSADGKRLVYCASRGDGECHLYLYDKDTFKRITDNKGNNVSPTLSADGAVVYFCSDFQTGTPQIYSYRIDNHTLERLTTGGYCASPSYSSESNKVVYCKTVQGVAQIFVYDCAVKTHTQLTFDPGNKEDTSWSPCGNYIVFSHQQGKKCTIHMLNTLSKERKTLIDNGNVCTYATWSPLYHVFPVVL
jgi:TolB protein